MQKLSELIEYIGPSLLRLLSAPASLDAPIQRLVVDNFVGTTPVARGDFVVGVALSPEFAADTVLPRLEAAGGGVVILRTQPETHLPVSLTGSTTVGVVSVPVECEWVPIIGLLTAAIASSHGADGSGERRLLDGSGNLFSAANLLADILDSPVTIEDIHSRVLAFSNRQERGDVWRTEAILRRVSSHEALRLQRAAGVTDRLARETGIVYVKDLAPDLKPRAAVALRAGNLLLGAIWVVIDRALTAEQEHAFVETSRLVALQVLRDRLASDANETIEAELVRKVLIEMSNPASVIERLGIQGERLWVVGAHPVGADEAIEAVLARCRNQLSFHFATPGAKVPSAVIHHTAYAILATSASAERDGRRLASLLQQFASRVSAISNVRVVAALAGPVAGGTSLVGARGEVDSVLDALVHKPAPDSATTADMRWELMTAKIADLLAAQPILAEGPLDLLRRHDDLHLTTLSETLDAYLTEMGEVSRAARRLGVHANTVRYRLRQVREVGNVDLADADQRLGLAIQLAVRRHWDSRGVVWAKGQIERLEFEDSPKSNPGRRPYGAAVSAK